MAGLPSKRLPSVWFGIVLVCSFLRVACLCEIVAITLRKNLESWNNLIIIIFLEKIVEETCVLPRAGGGGNKQANYDLIPDH